MIQDRDAPIQPTAALTTTQGITPAPIRLQFKVQDREQKSLFSILAFITSMGNSVFKLTPASVPARPRATAAAASLFISTGRDRSWLRAALRASVFLQADRRYPLLPRLAPSVRELRL